MAKTVLNEKQPITMDELKTVIASKFDAITPHQIGDIFNVGNDGKLIRRHLRKNFAQPMGHEHNTNWAFKTASKNGKMPETTVDVLKYFYGMYAVNMDVVNGYKMAKTPVETSENK
jgi:hypothetical protein